MTDQLKPDRPGGMGLAAALGCIAGRCSVERDRVIIIKAANALRAATRDGAEGALEHGVECRECGETLFDGPCSYENCGLKSATPKPAPDAVRITICGSARFANEIDRANRRLSLQGHIVYSIVPLVEAMTAEQKETLRKIHRAKIDASDAIYVIALEGYIGPDVAAEIAFAKAADKVVLNIDEHGDAAAYGPAPSAALDPISPWEREPAQLAAEPVVDGALELGEREAARCGGLQPGWLARQLAAAGERAANMPNWLTRESDTGKDRIQSLLKRLAFYYDVNDCHERDDDDALEVPICDLKETKEIFATLSPPCAGAAEPVARDTNVFSRLADEPLAVIPEGYSAPLDIRTAAEIEFDRKTAKADAILSFPAHPHRVERGACDRTETIIERALNCHWITVIDREQFKKTLRIALDIEVEAGGPYLNNGWNRHVD